MNFLTQRLSNKFPSYTKIRKDRSSYGQIYLDTFAEGISLNKYTNSKLLRDRDLFKRAILDGSLYVVALEDTEQIERVLVGNQYQYENLNVSVIVDEVGIIVNESEQLSDIYNAVPMRWSVNSVIESSFESKLIWSSEDRETINPIPFRERLWIYVTGSTWYANKNSRRDKNSNGNHIIKITGKDWYYSIIEEVINIYDDGTFISNNCFAVIDKIEYEGFDGEITIYLGKGEASIEHETNMTLVFDNFEGPMLIKISDAFVDLYSKRLKTGKEYRHENNDVDTIENEEVLLSYSCLDEEGNVIQPIALCMNPKNDLLYVLDNLGVIYLYNLELPSFNYELQDSYTNYIDLIPLSNYAEFEREEYVWTRFNRMSANVSWITIERIDPNGDVKYYNRSTESWEDVEYRNMNTSERANDIRAWQDFKMVTAYDIHGIWTYVCTVQSDKNLTKSTTQVAVPVLEPVRTLYVEMESLPINIYIGDAGDLVIETEDSKYSMKEHLDIYIINHAENKIYFTDEYDSIEVNKDE